jgi:hypothetical protein
MYPYEYSTTNDEIVKDLINNGKAKLVKKVQMNTFSVSELKLDINSSQPSLLSIDCEGLDLEVLKTIDLKTIKFRVICAEDFDFNPMSKTSEINQYLNKNVGFSDGSIAYVNNQGIAKPFTSQEIYNNTKGKNGCPSELVSLNMPWSFVEGDVIPTNPNLIVGSAMVSGQSCGNEGLNVIANKLTNSISSSYIGCYNDTINNTNVVAIPVMNSSNNVNGFVSKASSTYLNNVAYGSWNAFDQNPNTYWHSDDKIFKEV